MKKEFVDNILNAFLGFDGLYDELNFVNNIDNKFINSNYPPCDIIKRYTDQSHKEIQNYQLNFALAGYSREDIEIKEVKEDGKRYLNINNNKYFDNNQTEEDIAYIKKSISYKKFSIDFMLSDELEITSAYMIKGFLTIILTPKHIQKEESSKIIEID